MCGRMANLDCQDLDVIAALLVRAGAVMEDESVVLVSQVAAEADVVKARALHFVEVAADLIALAAAANALLRISERQP